MELQPNQNLLDLITSLEERIKNLEEENVETTNTLYEIMESVRAVDARIDILAGEPYHIEDFTLGK